MTRAEQVQAANKAKAVGVRAFYNTLRPYFQEVITSYRIGNETINDDAKDELRRGLRQGYLKTASALLHFDPRQYKAGDMEMLDEVRREIAAAVNILVVKAVAGKSDFIIGTTEKWVKRTTFLAMANVWGTPEARAALSNYLSSQKLIIATSESQFIVEGTRRAVVIAVKDPLMNSVNVIARMFENGDINGARRLSRQIVKLANLPTSISQGEFLRIVEDARIRLLTPFNQGRVVSNLREKAEAMEATEKEWQILGYHTRDTHEQVNGQRQPIDTPFILPGGLLQYPGDASLGASLSEIINCNCVAVYI